MWGLLEDDRTSLVAQRLKGLPAMQETQVQSLGREDPLKKEMVNHSSILAWRIPWTEKTGRLQSTGSIPYLFSNFQFSHSVVFNSLQPHGMQRARLPCLSPAPGAC